MISNLLCSLLQLCEGSDTPKASESERQRGAMPVLFVYTRKPDVHLFEGTGPGGWILFSVLAGCAARGSASCRLSPVFECMSQTDNVLPGEPARLQPSSGPGFFSVLLRSSSTIEAVPTHSRANWRRKSGA